MTIDPKNTKVSIGIAVVMALVISGWAWNLSGRLASSDMKIEAVIKATEPIPQMKVDIALIKQAVGVRQVSKR